MATDSRSNHDDKGSICEEEKEVKELPTQNIVINTCNDEGASQADDCKSDTNVCEIEAIAGNFSGHDDVSANTVGKEFQVTVEGSPIKTEIIDDVRDVADNSGYDESIAGAACKDFPVKVEDHPIKNEIVYVEPIANNISSYYDNSGHALIKEYPVTIENHSVKKEARDYTKNVADISNKVTLKRKSESLALISSYDMSSESENEFNTNSFIQHQTIIISDSDSESGSVFNVESDASNEFSQSSDEEAGGDEGGAKKKKKGASSAVSKAVSSCLDLGELPPIKDLHISVKEEECLPFGKVHSVVETLVVIESLPYVPALNLESVLFNKNGEPLGEVFDVFGPVKRPYYTIRFKSQKDIEEKSLSVGAVVYCAPKTKYTQYVFIHQLAKLRGSDASWKNDVEPPPEYLEYSDDEQESRARQALRMAKLNSRIVKTIDLSSSPPEKKSNFEERMNQRNTLRNQMFINNSSSPSDNQLSEWLRIAGGASGLREDGGPSGSGGQVRRATFNLPFHSPRTPPSCPPQNRSSGFQLTPGGFLAGRGMRFQGTGHHSNGMFGQSSCFVQQGGFDQLKYGPPPFSQPTAFGQPQGPSFIRPQGPSIRQPLGPTYGQPQGPPFGQSGFPMGRGPQLPPFLQTAGFSSPHIQFNPSVFPPTGSPRPISANSPPYIPPNPFSFPPNQPPHPNQNSGYPTNMFSNNSPFSQFRHFKQN